MVKEVYIVGAGMGEQQYLSKATVDTVSRADMVLTTERLYNKLSYLNSNSICTELSNISKLLCESDVNTAVVLASGDVGFYSVARSLKTKLVDAGIENIKLISGISSLQYLTAKLGIGYDDIKVVSTHGRNTNPIPYVCYNKKVFFLTGGNQSAEVVVCKLVKAGLGHVTVTVGENLSDTNEVIVTDSAQNLCGQAFSQLAVLFVENDSYADHNKKIYDNEFIRGKAPMTKEAVRTLSISYLEISKTDVVVDIGAGTGSCSVEMARRANEGMVYAIERDEQSAELIHHNIDKFKAYNIDVISGIAPDAIAEISVKIDRAFIGGSAGKLAEIVRVLSENNPEIRIVINAITLETLNEAVSVFASYGVEPIITCVNVSVAEKIGRYNMMKAQNPIYIIAGSLE